jgi:hypothetical protein
MASRIPAAEGTPEGVRTLLAGVVRGYRLGTYSIRGRQDSLDQTKESGIGQGLEGA